MSHYEEPHPFAKLDKRPIPWTSRGIGLDGDLVCFVCGADKVSPDAVTGYLHNIAAFVRNDTEAAALACFDIGARMAYYHGDPKAPQIKVGACDEHLKVLGHLSEQWFISQWRVYDLVRLYRKE